jgi:hypothetical protein
MTSHHAPSPSLDCNLRQVVEPLADYICAAERPRDVLLSVMAALLNEVRSTNQAALMHFAENRIGALDLAS